MAATDPTSRILRLLGLLQRRQTVVAYDLAGIATSVERLRDCAARTVASN